MVDCSVLAAGGRIRRPAVSRKTAYWADREMPRPTKGFRNKKTNAALAWKRGEKQEAYKLWEQAAASLKEHRESKRNKKKNIEAAKAAEAAKSAETTASSEASSD